MDNKKKRCLAIHGLGSGIQEMLPLAEYLKGLGYDASCPLLKGHSSTREDMKKATYKDWLASVESELLEAEVNSDEVLLVGCSLGGLIALNLACRYRNIKAVVTINTPIFDFNIRQLIGNLIADIKSGERSHIKLYKAAKGNSPFSSVVQLFLLQKLTKQTLGNLDCPILIIQAEDDEAVRRKSADYIYSHVSSERKRIVYFQKGGHLILQSPSAEDVIACIEDFIKSDFFV